MSYRKPQVIIGCRECEKNQRILRTGASILTVTTSFQEHELGELRANNYTCPYCFDTLEMPKIILNMCQQLMNGYAHIVSHPHETRVITEDATFGIPHDQRFESVKSILRLKGAYVEGIENHAFRNPSQDLALIFYGMNLFDTNKWIIIIEAKYQPEPLLLDDPFWSTQ